MKACLHSGLTDSLLDVHILEIPVGGEASSCSDHETLLEASGRPLGAPNKKRAS